MGTLFLFFSHSGSAQKSGTIFVSKNGAAGECYEFLRGSQWHLKGLGDECYLVFSRVSVIQNLEWNIEPDRLKPKESEEQSDSLTAYIAGDKEVFFISQWHQLGNQIEFRLNDRFLRGKCTSLEKMAGRSYAVGSTRGVKAPKGPGKPWEANLIIMVQGK